MKKINFISNQDLGITSGGWSGINWNIHQEMSKYFKINYVGPINPTVNFSDKLISKIKRSIGLKSKFSFFSNNRLNSIKNQVEKQKTKSDYDFYFGQTPWIDCENSGHYGVYLDADFQTYLNIFSKPESFYDLDIKRIKQKEEKWLQKAKDIFVGSQWAWEEMLKDYDLKEEQKVVVYTGGNVELPDFDGYKNEYNLVFISLNFEKKGGHICVEVFNKLKIKFPKVTLTIIGEKPPDKILKIEGIIYAGLLRKTNKLEFEKFKRILSTAFLLIHPTKMDTMGAVLIEAGYFGCPSIAPKSFGIPELVLDEKTGFVVSLPFDYNSFVKKIELLIEDKNRYLIMRKNAWTYTRTKLTWEHIGLKLKNRIQR